VSKPALLVKPRFPVRLVQQFQPRVRSGNRPLNIRAPRAQLHCDSRGLAVASIFAPVAFTLAILVRKDGFRTISGSLRL